MKQNFQKIHHQLFNSQLIKLSSSSEIDNIIQEEELIFKKTPTVDLSEVSWLIDSAIGKRQGGQRKHLMDRAIKQRVINFTKYLFIS